MKSALRGLLLLCTVVLCVLVSCGKKKAEEEKPVAIVGVDTLTRTEFSKLTADTVHSAGQLRSIVLQWVLAKQEPKPADSAAYEQTLEDLTQQLSLRSDRQWIKAEGALLLGAVRALLAKVDAVEEPSMASDYADSLASSIVIPGDTTKPKKAVAADEESGPTEETAEVDKRAVLLALVRRAFDLSPALAGIVVDFATEGTDWEEDAEVSDDIVKGLVYDSKVEAELERLKREKRRLLAQRSVDRPKPRPVRRDNWKEALKHRPRSSIVDSIGKHLPYLQSIYKKTLRKHQDMAGKVMVSIRIAASGEVISAKVTKSQIRHKAFLDPLLAHVKTIRFQPIPEKVGPTSIEFPFEFKAEE